MIMRLILSIVIFLTAGSSFAAQIAVIAHPSVNIDTLDKGRLYDIYRGEVRSWKDGTKIRVLDLGEKGETRDSFYDYLGKRPSRMKSIWMRQLLTGEGGPPEEAESEDDMIEKIVSTPGAIGYVDNAKVDDRVKRLLIISEDKKEKEEKD